MNRSDYSWVSTSFFHARQNENVESRERRNAHYRNKILRGPPEELNYARGNEPCLMA
jgi:hypothetical protein